MGVVGWCFFSGEVYLDVDLCGGFFEILCYQPCDTVIACMHLQFQGVNLVGDCAVWYSIYSEWLLDCLSYLLIGGFS